jgi:hypothetical protein
MLIVLLAAGVWAVAHAVVAIADVLRTVPRSNDDWVWY